MGEVEEHRDNRKSLTPSSPFFVCLTLLVHINFLRLVDLRLCLHICFLHPSLALCKNASLASTFTTCAPSYLLPSRSSFQPLGVERFRQLGARLVSLRVRGRACTRLHVGVCVTPELLAFSPDYPGSLSVTA